MLGTREKTYTKQARSKTLKFEKIIRFVLFFMKSLIIKLELWRNCQISLIIIFNLRNDPASGQSLPTTSEQSNTTVPDLITNYRNKATLTKI